MDVSSVQEDFFLESIDVGKVFQIIERADYLFLYNIKQCMKKTELEDGVYLTELAEYMELSIPDISKAVKKLQECGYVTWKMDEKKERTYVTLTNKAVENMHGQKRKLMEAYKKIIENVSKEDLEVTLHTMRKVRELLKEV